MPHTGCCPCSLLFIVTHPQPGSLVAQSHCTVRQFLPLIYDVLGVTEQILSIRKPFMCTSENCMLVRDNPICLFATFWESQKYMNILISKKRVANGAKNMFKRGLCMSFFIRMLRRGSRKILNSALDFVGTAPTIQCSTKRDTHTLPLTRNKTKYVSASSYCHLKSNASESLPPPEDTAHLVCG